MADATADWRAALTMMSDAFRIGDNCRGEDLLTFALDAGAPWDVATSTVAQALGSRATTVRPVSLPEAAPA
jgi:hypothetical protein